MLRIAYYFCGDRDILWILWWTESKKKTEFIWNIFNIINVSTVTFYLCIVSLLNNSINYFFYFLLRFTQTYYCISVFVLQFFAILRSLNPTQNQQNGKKICDPECHFTTQQQQIFWSHKNKNDNYKIELSLILLCNLFVLCVMHDCSASNNLEYL